MHRIINFTIAAVKLSRKLKVVVVNSHEVVKIQLIFNVYCAVFTGWFGERIWSLDETLILVAR